MFKRRVEDSRNTTITHYGFRIFFVHIINVIIMLIVGMLVENIKYIGIAVSDATTPVTVTVVCLIVYIVLVYMESWRTGQRDANLILYKHIQYNRYKPLYAAIVSQLPGILLAIAAVFSASDAQFVRYLRYFYLNFNYFMLTWGNVKIVNFIPIFIPIIIAPVAYHLGYRDFRLLDKLMFVNPNKQNADKNNKQKKNTR